jgi:hypothetical protein
MPRSILHCSKLPVSTKYFTDGECGSPGASGGFYLSSQSKQEVNYLSTRFDSAVILDTGHDYSAPGTAACGCHSLKPCDVWLPPSTRHNPTPLTVECEHCEDGIRWTSRYGGNDPDVWRVGPCETCDGTGRAEVVCEWCGDHGATDLLEGRPYHLECAEEVLADMYRVIERAA